MQQTKGAPVIPDRIIEDGTLRTDGERTSVEVRIPWYRALPLPSLAKVDLTVDGERIDPSSLHVTVNGHRYAYAEHPFPPPSLLSEQGIRSVYWIAPAIAADVRPYVDRLGAAGLSVIEHAVAGR